MTFYNNRVSVADVNGKEIYLIKNIKNELILNYYSKEGEIIESTLADDALDEFDILINHDNSVYLIYQDIKNYLNLLVLRNKDKTIHTLTTESFPKIFELNILKHNDKISMVFLYPINNSQRIFMIEHYMLEDDKWYNYKVDQARVSQVLNPIKLIHGDGFIYLAYYYEDQICLKTFDEIEMEWKESIILTDNKEKLYLDLLLDGEYFHLVYSESLDDNYVVEYRRYNHLTLIEDNRSTISLKSNGSNPTLIIKDKLLWLVWNESSRIYSRYSRDRGKTWSEIMNWDEAFKESIVRYKYTSNRNSEDMIIHNSFGTIHPDVKFIGFK